MARQLALLFLRRLEVPIVLRDLTQEQIDDAVDWIPGELAALVAKGRLERRQGAASSVDRHRRTGYDVFAGCDLVLEAVFEEIDVKQAGLRARSSASSRPTASSPRTRRRSP